MAAPTSVHLLVVNSTVWYDLRKVVCWSYADDYTPPNGVQAPGSWVRLQFDLTSPMSSVYVDRTAFETQKALSLAGGG